MTPTTDTPEVMALRGNARHALTLGADHGVVVFGLVRDAGRRNVSSEDTARIVAELRAEGLIPPEPAA